MTEIPDLRLAPPRRWNAELEGIAWLPRLIDKARAVNGGTLGDYLYGQSPTDTGLLRTLGVGYRSFAAMVAAAPDDAAVVAALGARDPEALERGRAFSAELVTHHKLFLFLMDVDDGYAPGYRWFKRPLNAATGAFTGVLKRVFPLKPAGRV